MVQHQKTEVWGSSEPEVLPVSEPKAEEEDQPPSDLEGEEHEAESFQLE
jgi:hypothetical protein